MAEEEIAAFLTLPNGKTREERGGLQHSGSIIESAPSYRPVEFSIDDPAPAGNYNLVIRTKDKILYEEAIVFSHGKLAIKDVKLNYDQEEALNGVAVIGSVEFQLEKDRHTLPISLKNLAVAVDGDPFRPLLLPFQSRCTKLLVTSENGWVKIGDQSLMFDKIKTRGYGSICLQKGKEQALKFRLYYQGNQCAEFEKKFTAR